MNSSKKEVAGNVAMAMVVAGISALVGEVARGLRDRYISSPSLPVEEVRVERS